VKDAILGALIPISLLFVIMLGLILLIRLALNTILFYLVKKRLKQTLKPKTVSQPQPIQTEDELLRNQKQERTRLMHIKRLNNLKNEFEEEPDLRNKLEVVKKTRMLGFWCAFVLGQRLTLLVNKAADISEEKQQGFWVSLTEAQVNEIRQEQNQGRSL
jgi:hypothetical protein